MTFERRRKLPTCGDHIGGRVDERLATGARDVAGANSPGHRREPGDLCRDPFALVVGRHHRLGVGVEVGCVWGAEIRLVAWAASELTLRP
jgi:hypothetical protein